MIDISDHQKRLHLTLRAAGITVESVSGGPSPESVQVHCPAEQQSAAQAIVVAFDWTEGAHVNWEEDRRPERKTLRQAAQQTMTNNQTYLNLSNPSPAQIAAQVRRLTEQMNTIIPRLIQID